MRDNCDGGALAEVFTRGLAIPGHEWISSKLEVFNSSADVLQIDSVNEYSIKLIFSLYFK